MAKVLVLRIIGSHSYGYNIKYRKSELLFWPVVASLLVFVEVRVGVDNAMDAHSMWTSIAWTCYIFFAAVAVTGLAHVLTQGFRRLTYDLDVLLTARGRRRIMEWLDKSHRTRPQLFLSLSMAITLSVVVGYWLNIAQQYSVLSPFILFAVFGCGFVVGGCLYWLLEGLRGTYLATRPGMLALFDSAPGRTPGIEHYARLLGSAFAACAALSLVFLLPYALGAFSVNDESAAQSSYAIRLGLLAAAGVVTLVIGVLPQVWFTQAIQRSRHLTMRTLIRRMAHASSESERLGLMESFLHVADSPQSTVSADNVAQILVGAAALTVPFFIGLVVR